jgi:transposase
LGAAHARRGKCRRGQDDDVTSNKVVRQLEERVRELERQLGRKTLEAEILREAVDKARSKKATWLVRSQLKDDFR